jgi:hypothetical protein
MKGIDDQTLERIIAWIDGDLDPTAREAFEDELAQDADLQDAVDAYRSTMEALPALEVEAPPDFEQRVQRRIRRRSRGRFFNPDAQQHRMQAAVFAAVAALLLGGIALFSSTGPIRLLWTDEGSGASTTDDMAPNEGSADQSAPGPRLDDALMLPSEPARTDRVDGRSTPGEGSTSGLATVDPMRVSWTYTIQTDLDTDALRARLDDEFGRMVRVADGGFEVVVPAREHRDALRALGRLGEVTRERTERPAVLTERIFRVRPRTP